MDKKMNVVLIRPNLKKSHFIPVRNIEANLAQNGIDFLRNHSTAIFGRTDQVIQKQRNIVAFVDIPTGRMGWRSSHSKSIQHLEALDLRPHHCPPGEDKETKIK